MFTNTDITVYNKYTDPVTLTDKYRRTVIHNVQWFVTETAKRVDTGRNADDKAYVIIPFSSAQEDVFLTPFEYNSIEDKSGFFTLAPSDRIVRGIIDYEVTGRISELEKAYDTYTITALDTRDFGNDHMKHWAVTAK
jgi:hypothetical protein